MTPQELTLYAQGYAEMQKEAYKTAITEAYYTAALQRTKRLPRLETLTKDLEKKPKFKKQKPEDMLNSVRAINAMLKRGK